MKDFLERGGALWACTPCVQGAATLSGSCSRRAFATPG
jgi:hypothetical protein